MNPSVPHYKTVNMTNEKTKLTAKSIVDGIGTYLLWYVFTSFMLWIGIKLINIYAVTWLQCLGSIMVYRQLKALLFTESDLHIKKDLTNKNK